MAFASGHILTITRARMKSSKYRNYMQRLSFNRKRICMLEIKKNTVTRHI